MGPTQEAGHGNIRSYRARRALQRLGPSSDAHVLWRDRERSSGLHGSYRRKNDPS